MSPYYSVLAVDLVSTKSSGYRSTVLKELDKTEYDRYISAYNRLDELLNMSIFSYLESAKENLHEAMKSNDEQVRLGHDFTNDDAISEIGMRTRNAALAFCSALHFHQEHTYYEVLLTNTDHGFVHKKVITVFNKLHENSRDYRLLYHLRNTMVHYTMNVVDITVKQTGFATGPTKRSVNANINTYAIANMNEKLNEKYLAELLATNEKPDLLECVSRAYPHIERANDKIVAILFPSIEEDVTTINEFVSLFPSSKSFRYLTTKRSNGNTSDAKYMRTLISSKVIRYCAEYRG